MKRISTLDGWRGIAILLVLFDHIQVATNGHYFFSWAQTGEHGVTVFFVLSGFLITSKLTEKSIDLRAFYIRRFFRLMPVAWIYLATLFFVGWRLNQTLITWDALRRCLLFYQNFPPKGPADGLSSHFWSLSLEEQFYLIWPPLLLMLGSRKCRGIATIGILICAIYRWTHWAHYDDILMSRQSQVRADALLVGCLLALFLQEDRFRSYASRFSVALTVPSLAVVAVCFERFHWLPPLCECLAIAALICATVLHPKSMPSRALSFTPLTKLGVVSYSIYIWQQLFMGLEGKALIIGLCIELPLVVFLTYEYIELPCIRLGHKLARTSTPPATASRLSVAGEPS
ncbi:MAG TPA: acyltransferase [Acidobacteriaceae bacterium]|jgi:peptidoglycan/LPS O-acetylase OafA/YrhL|nr:acyltransferase [Acidobacteriaceae bacterium]